MRSLKRLVYLPKKDRSLLLEAAFLIVMVRIILRCLPLRNAQRTAIGIARVWRSDTPYAPDRVIWAVQKAAPSIPGSRCLVQALVAQALLVRYSYKPCLTIGVTKDDRLQLEAHAWVTNDNQILIGDHESGRYTTLLTLGS